VDVADQEGDVADPPALDVAEQVAPLDPVAVP
jgi:hypothetical protein